MIGPEDLTRSFVGYLGRVRLIDRFALGRRLLAVIALATLRRRPDDDGLWHDVRRHAFEESAPELKRSLNALAQAVEKHRPDLRTVFSHALTSDLSQAPELAEIVQAGWIFEREFALLPVEDFISWLGSRLDDTTAFGPIISDKATSGHLSNLMVRLAEVEPGASVYDPCCGFGNLLAAAARATDGDVSLKGIEAHPSSWAFAKLRLTLADRADVELGDALRSAPLRAGGYDRILCEPPAGGVTPFRVQEMPRAPSMGLRSLRGDSAFVEYCADVLAPGGRAAILVSQALLSRKGYDERLRRRLLVSGQLKAIVSLPANVGAWAPADLAVLILRGRGYDPGPVRMVDGTRVLGKERRGTLTLGEIDSLTRLALGPPSGDVASDVAFFDLLENDRFRPASYFNLEPEHVDISALMAEADELDRMAQSQAAQIRSLSSKLQSDG